MKADVAEICKSLSEEVFGQAPETIVPLNVSGSARRYYRLFFPEQTCLACLSENTKENKTFISLTAYLLERDIAVPEIYAVSPDCDAYLLEDLGDTDLFSLIIKDRESEALWRILEATVSRLVDFQTLKKDAWEKIVEFPPLDSELIRYDFAYAVNNLINLSDITYDSAALQRDFNKLEKRLLSYPRHLWGLMYRDFQSRNIIVKEKPYFIDYQSCRFGPGIYDLVSFAWQAKAGFSSEDKKKLADIYISELKRRGVDCSDEVLADISYWAAFRIIQTLGAYGLRGLKEGKPHFIDSIRPAVANLKNLMEKEGLKNEFGELYGVSMRLAELYPLS